MRNGAILVLLLAAMMASAQDDTMASVLFGNKKEGQTIEGTIDYFTKDDDDSAPDAFQSAFNAAGFAWTLNQVQYEEETRYIHYEWLFWVENQP